MDSLQVVKNKMRVEVTNEIKKGNIIKYTSIKLPFVTGVAHWLVTMPFRLFIKNKNLLICFSSLGANTESTIYLILRSPNVCVQNKFLFALLVKLGGIVLFNDSFKRISSCNMVVLLDQLTLDDMNNTFNEIKFESEDKVFLEATVNTSKKNNRNTFWIIFISIKAIH